MSNYPPGSGQTPRPGPYPPPFPAGDERTTILPSGGYRPAGPPPDERTTVLPQGYPRSGPPPGWMPAPPPGYPFPPPGFPPPPVQPQPTPPRSRRNVLIGTGVAVVAAAGGFATYAAVRPNKDNSAPPGVTDSTPTVVGTDGALAKVADIPESGGLVLADEKVVLTRPTGDQVKAFTAVCTHQGCLVATVSAGAIHCPCHGSAFDVATGAVVNGPASQPLAAIGITVADGVVRKG